MTQPTARAVGRRRPTMLDLVTLASLIYFPLAVTAMIPFLVPDPSHLLDAFPDTPPASA